jgi:hypothetical protein
MAMQRVQMPALAACVKEALKAGGEGEMVGLFYNYFYFSLAKAL